MSVFNWQASAATLAADLALATGSDATYAAGLLASLNSIGPAYSAAWTSAVDTSRTADESAFNTALFAWQASAVLAHAQADRSARYAESLQAASQAGTVAHYVAGSSVLAPDAALVLTLDGAAEPATTGASLTLTTSGAPAVTIAAKDLGAAGNGVEVEITNGTTSGVFNLNVRRGTGYVESFQSVVPGAALPKGSLLVGSWTWAVPHVRPDNTTWGYLTAGAGNAHAAIVARLQAAQSFSATTPALAALLAAQLATVNAAMGSPPTLVYSATSSPNLPPNPGAPALSITDADTQLRALADQATAFHSYRASGLS